DTWQRLAQAPQTRFYNVYGPTECTVDATAIDTRERPDRPTIGRPLANVFALVLDRHGQPVPIGVPGELYIGGAGVARGYWNRPALTAERFVPFGEGAPSWGLPAGEEHPELGSDNSTLKTQHSKLYKTGDLCRWLPDGTLEYLGRTDYQVKLRGFRIELDEIEAALRAHPDVRDVVVTAREDGGDKRLVAYVIPTERRTENGEQDTDDPELHTPEGEELKTQHSKLRTYLKERLPEYMVPTAFVWLDALPLSPNGKINHKALPAPDTTRLESDQPYEAPRTQLESLLAGMWAEHFRANRVGIRDNFFELGGNSIQAAVLINRLQEQIGEYVSVIALFEAPTVADLAGYLAQHHGAALAARGLSATEPGTPSAAAGALDTIPPAPRGPDALLPLSFAQQRLWFLDQLEPGSPLYNVPTGVRMRGTLDTAALQRSLDDLVERHESLRTAFAQVDGQPIQLIAPATSLPIALIDLSDLPAPERETTARSAIVAEAQRPFDLARSPLARATLVRLGQQEHILLLNLHHIVSDGWSMGVLIRELAALYAAHVRGQRAALPPLPVQYADFAVWQRGWFQGSLLEQQLNYWKHKLAGAPAALDLPTDRPRPPVQTFRGATVPFQLPAALSQALAALSRREGATLFMTLLAAFQTLLFRYSGQEDILVGSPIANRTRKEIEGLIGFFVNTLVLRGDLSGNPTFRQLLEQVRETALGAFSHQDLPFEYLVEAVQPERDLSRSPLFQVMLVLQNTPGGALNLPGLTLEALDGEGSTAKFDLLLALVELPGGLAGDLEYNTDLFDRATAERMLAHFQALLEGIVQNPDGRVGDLPLLGAAERARLLGDWNSTAAPYPDLAAHQLVERQAARTPEAVAVVSGAGQLTYAELDTRANRLAHHLLAAGVRPDTPVGICMERSPELVVGILAILKAGAAYVPLDPAYPPERLALMLGDARADVLLTRPGAWAPADGPTVIDLERDWPAIERRPAHAPDLAVGLDQLAYVIYTSGSTGVPKGVAMPHRPLVNLIAWQQTQIPGAARTLQFASPSFDVSFQEMFSTWASGGALVLPAEALRRDPAELLRFLDEQRVERLFMPFVALQQLAEAIAEEGRAPAYLRDVITAGEQLLITPAIARWFAAEPRPRLHNHYGPSETHVVTAHTLDGDPAAWPGLPPIGRPIANTQAYILDRAGQPAPVGVAGELLFGGDNLARGYLHRPNLTAERFVPNPFGVGGAGGRGVGAREGQEPERATADGSNSKLKPQNSKLYKTGDLARYRPDGTIEFLGRADTQVKIRGYRIEPGEIETVLAQHPQVREAVVVVRPDPRGAKQLVAYVVLAQGPEAESTKDTKDTNGSEPGSAENSKLKTQTSELRAFLARRLPDYMVPSAFAVLERWPLTPSGKVDRRALPAPGEGDSGREGFLAPRDALELRIARIWEELLGVQPVGIRESFFELGGHSLLVVRLMSQIQKQLGQKLPLATLFQEATVEHLARSLRQSGAALPRTPLVPIQPGGSRLPFFCVHPGAGNVLSYLELARLLGPDQPFYGLQAAGLDGEAPPRESVDAMAEAYLAALREVQPEGPYLLGGWSFGGMVAYEMARRLTVEGQEVALLALIDSWAPTEAPVPAPDDAALLGWFAADLGRTLGADLRVSAETFAQIAPERRLAYVLDQARAAQVLPPDIGEREVEQYIAVFKASLTAMGSYPRRPYAGRATLFRAGDRPLDQAGPTLGWEGLVAGGVALHVLPGDHYSIVRQPNVAALAEQITACLDEVDAARGAVGNA
ncbi:MAG TPA: amino acid adenylation domain-containing protein, partial [Roseiflexaceae bacterium]|nr:amino acid adenylation domain-containing protein [Roseiflexaceae bacterium]